MASAASALVLAPWLARGQSAPGAPAASNGTADALFHELDERIEAAMKRYQVPGVAVGVWWQGREHLRGFGVTNVDHPLLVDADTLFRIGSTTKTFTATAMMRLVEQGRIDLLLVAEDHPINLKLVQVLLQAAGCRFRCVENGAGALAELDAGSFDLIGHGQPDARDDGHRGDHGDTRPRGLEAVHADPVAHRPRDEGRGGISHRRRR